MNHDADNFYKIVAHIDRLLSLPFSADIAAELFELINDHENRNTYFLKKIESTSWFDALRDRGYFSPDRAPGVMPAEQEGLFIIPQWSILPYLEKVSQQIGEPANEKYVEELLRIINAVSIFKDQSGRHIDNYRTWWFFVKILINLPADKISARVIDLIPIWLSSKFDTSVIGADILNKMLPKFLEGTPSAKDITKAEKIISYVTALKLVKGDQKRTAVIYKEKYKSVIEYYWLEKALKKYGQQIGEKCSKRVVTDLCRKVRKVLKTKESKVPFRVENKDYLLTLQEKGEGSYLLKVVDIGKSNKEKSYEIYFEESSSGKKLKRKVLEEYTVAFENVSRYVIEAHMIMKNDPLFLSYEDEELDRDLFHLYTNLYSRETYHSLYQSRYQGENASSLLTLALKEILLSKARKDSGAMNQILKSFFEERYLYFPKMALYIIGNTGNVYIERFWELLKSENYRIILDSSACADELRHILQNVAADLSEAKEKMLEDAIERGTMYVAGQNKELQINIWKQERYAALSANHHFKSLHENLKEKTGFLDLQLQPAIGEGVTWVGPGPSALSAEQILQMTNSEVASYLAKFEERDPWHGPTARGLAEELKKVATDRPEKFVDDFYPFLSTAYLYVVFILWGIRDAWAKKKIVDWERLFGFLLVYVDRPDFWQDKLPIASERSWSSNHESVSGMIAEMVQEGVKDDASAFPEIYFKHAKEVLRLILNGLVHSPKSEGKYSDYVTHALNSTWGKVISALFLLVLRIVRVNEKKGDKKEDKKDVKWDVALRSQYDDLMNREIVEAYTWFGHYLPQFYYLDKEWTEIKVAYLDGKKYSKVWEAFMNGYLYGGTVYHNIYELMKSHYEKGIGYSFKETHDRERLIQHVCIGYLYGYETIEDTGSLFRKVIDNWKHEHMRDVINYFWMQRDTAKGRAKYTEKNRKKIIFFWKLAYEKYANKAPEVFGKDDKILLSDISKLTVFLNEIDEDNLKWLLLSAPYVQEHFNAPFFIEYLDELKAKGDRGPTADRIGEVYLEILKHMTPDFDEAHIRSIVEFLYQAGAREKADKICNIYGARENYFLRDIYEKYNAV